LSGWEPIEAAIAEPVRAAEDSKATGSFVSIVSCHDFLSRDTLLGAVVPNGWVQTRSQC